jgi:hypothetical protein
VEELGETQVGAVLSTTALHVAALRDAGFREVDTIWQVLANRVVLAVR